MGKPGRELAFSLLPRLRAEMNLDFVVVNAENAAAGAGITPEIAEQFLNQGADVVTLGNHSWDKREIVPLLENQPRLLRPANYPPDAPGRGWGIYPCRGQQVAVVSMMGRLFMNGTDCPFRAADALLPEIRKSTHVVLVDFHAEATSEKQAFGYYLDGRVSVVAGTHTHVQTADERILPAGTAYLTDLGMTGPVHSVIGVKPDVALSRFLSPLHARMEVAEGDAQLCAALIEVHADGRAAAIKRLQIPQRPAEAAPLSQETRT